jgi:glycosyl hydrolase family 38
VRFFETGGQPAEARIRLGTGVAAAESVDFLEHPHGNGVCVADGVAVVSFRPYEIKTLALELER